ncbi:SIMPL domain-containing protein, partial [Acinetobacter baumannii]
AVSRSISELIASGVAMDSEAPQYIYTKIGDVKVEILSEAAKDARRRAEEIAKASGGSITGFRSARMSPLQISPAYDYAIVGEG